MLSDELFGYLTVTGQIDDVFGLKKDIIECPECGSELYNYDGDIYFCKRCNNFSEYNTKKKVYNKKLTYQEKINIDKNFKNL